MNFFKRSHTFRRYQKPEYIGGYQTASYEDMALPADVQTMENASITASDGTRSLQRLKVFCDLPLFTEEEGLAQKADRLFHQGKWFSCTACRLSENTPLRHYTAIFTECLDKENPPGLSGERESI